MACCFCTIPYPSPRMCDFFVFLVPAVLCLVSVSSFLVCRPAFAYHVRMSLLAFISLKCLRPLRAARSEWHVEEPLKSSPSRRSYFRCRYQSGPQCSCAVWLHGRQWHYPDSHCREVGCHWSHVCQLVQLLPRLLALARQVHVHTCSSIFLRHLQANDQRG